MKTTWSLRVRRFHRWLSVVFTLSVIGSIAAVSQQDSPEWVFYLPLLPLVLQLITGLFLFVLPYTAKRRNRRTAAVTN